MKKYKHDYHSVKNLSRPQNELVKDLSRKKFVQIIAFNCNPAPHGLSTNTKQVKPILRIFAKFTIVKS